MIVYSCQHYIPQLKHIWKSVFGDSDDYIKLFFEKKYRDEETLLYVENSKVLSMLFFLRYNMKVYENIYPSGYICGAATLPEYRGKGLMDSLLKRSFDIMLKRGDFFSVLIPAEDKLYGFYSRYGYHPIFKRGFSVYVKKPKYMGNDSLSISQSEDISRINSLYQNIINKHRVVLLQNEFTYSIVVQIYKTYGNIYIIYDKKGIGEGYLFCQYYEKEKILWVKEITADVDILPEISVILMDMYNAEKLIFEGPYAGALSFAGVKTTGMLKVLKGDFNIARLEKEYPYMNMMLD